MFGGEDPIGEEANFDLLNITAEIVGVVGHVKQWGLDTDSTFSVQAQGYTPIAQIPDQFMPLAGRGVRVVVRGVKRARRLHVHAVSSSFLVWPEYWICLNL